MNRLQRFFERCYIELFPCRYRIVWIAVPSNKTRERPEHESALAASQFDWIITKLRESTCSVGSLFLARAGDFLSFGFEKLSRKTWKVVCDRSTMLNKR